MTPPAKTGTAGNEARHLAGFASKTTGGIEMHQPMQGAQAQVLKQVFNKDKGWGCPILSKKAQYFEGGMSLCRKWMFGGELEDGRHDHKQNCLSCRKALEKKSAKS